MLIADVIRILEKTVLPDIKLCGVALNETKRGVSVTVYLDDGQMEERQENDNA